MIKFDVPQKYKENVGMFTVELLVICAVVVIVMIAIYGILIKMNIIENIIIWFSNSFARGTVNI